MTFLQDGFLQVSLKKMVRIKGVVCVGAPCGGGCVAVGVTVWRPDVRWVAAVADWSVPAWGHRPARFGRSQKRRVYIEKEDEKCEVGWGGRGGGSQMLRHYIEMTQKKCEFETVGGGGWVWLPPLGRPPPPLLSYHVLAVGANMHAVCVIGVRASSAGKHGPATSAHRQLTEHATDSDIPAFACRLALGPHTRRWQA